MTNSISDLPLSKQFGRFIATIDTEDGESTWCHVADSTRPSLAASLDYIRGGGFLEDSGRTMAVPDAIADAIHHWAVQTGVY